jgi:hypothetical protein
MRRMIYEWGFLFAAGAAICLVGYWAVSLVSDVGGFEVYLPLGSRRAMPLGVGVGALTLKANPGSSQAIQWVLEYRAMVTPLPKKTQRVTFPGFQFRRVVWSDGPSDWSVRVSCGYLGLAMGAIAAVCLWRLRAALRKRKSNEANRRL